MPVLAKYLEEIPLGIVDNPHAGQPTILTEMVTVCPSCRSLHSLRREKKNVYCIDCDWKNGSRLPKTR